jgi:hypothetical protein
MVVAKIFSKEVTFLTSYISLLHCVQARISCGKVFNFSGFKPAGHQGKEMVASE